MPRAHRAIRRVVEVHRTLAGGGQTVLMTAGYEPLEDRLEEMVALWGAASPGELHRALVLRSPTLGDSHDAFEPLLLFRSAHEDRPEGAAETAMLLLTDWRWRRGTGRLVRAIEESGLVPEDDLDLLARAFLVANDEVYWKAPADWFEGPEVTLHGSARTGGGESPTGSAGPVVIARSVWPPLRRWAAARLVRAEPSAWPGVVARARELDARAGAAVMAGVIDGADVLPPPAGETVITVALEWPARAPRLAALEYLAGHGQADRARACARRDSDAAIRRWADRPAPPPPPPQRPEGRPAMAPTAARPEPATLF